VARNALVDIVARAIRRLSELPDMPDLPGVGGFTDLPSFFVNREKQKKQSVAVGPSGTNVVYAVGTRNEAIQFRLANIGNYDDARERWTPFADAPGATIELVTREGLNTVGQDDVNYRNLGLPPIWTTGCAKPEPPTARY
jgi:hypothetical protein